MEATQEAAEERAQRLLDFDRNSTRRTRVIDDQADWYTEAENPWNNKKQQQLAKQQAIAEELRQTEERRKNYLTFDFAGRTITSDTQTRQLREEQERHDFEVWREGADKERTAILNPGLTALGTELWEKLKTGMATSAKPLKSRDDLAVGDPRKNLQYKVKVRADNEFSETCESDAFKKAETIQWLPIEESPYTDAADDGSCLSMHQPWASLLVYGFKRAEGRVWSTNHRGRLWIHATSQEPDPETIRALHEKYSALYEGQMPGFPPSYPTSCVLGCVDLEECWPNEEYREFIATNHAPDEESESPHIFWCARPRKLVVPVKMTGDHKIWRLPKKQLVNLQQGLQPVMWPIPKIKALERFDPAQFPQIDLFLKGEKLCKKARGKDDRKVIHLQDGLVVLPNLLTIPQQQEILQELREQGLEDKAWFTEKVGNAARMCFGKHWNAVTKRWEDHRGDVDGKPAAPLTPARQYYRLAVEKANKLVKEANFTTAEPGLMIVNYISETSSVSLEREKGEVLQSEEYPPVISLCIGDACDFEFANERSAGPSKMQRLESGDCVVFGGKSRHLYHGIPRIVKHSSPPELKMIPGTLSITMRAF